MILASNAPGVVVLGPLRTAVSAPVIGVFPPVAEALAASKTGMVAVLGVRSMVTSEAMRARADSQRAADSEVTLVNASSLVDLVESFALLSEPDRTQRVVSAFIADLRDAHPDIDVMTMSSTHLPWLKPFFTVAAPAVAFLDPADSVLEQLAPHVSEGTGRTRCIATATPALTPADFNAALAALGTPHKAALKDSLAHIIMQPTPA